MKRLLIDYWRQWRPDILRWIAATLIFALFAWIIVDYFDFFEFLFERRVLRQGMTLPRLCRSITSTMAHTPLEVRLLCFEQCASLGKTSVKKGGDSVRVVCST